MKIKNIIFAFYLDSDESFANPQPPPNYRMHQRKVDESMMYSYFLLINYFKLF